MTSSAERLAAQILGSGVEAGRHRGVALQHPMRSSDRIALEHLGLEQLATDEDGHIPGTRNTLPHDPFAPPFSRPGAEQAQYRAGYVPSAQLRRPQQVQGTTRARGRNSWGAADQRQLGGVRPESGSAA